MRGLTRTLPYLKFAKVEKLRQLMRSLRFVGPSDFLPLMSDSSVVCLYFNPGASEALKVAGERRSTRIRDVTRLRLGVPKPPKDVAAPSNWNGNRSFLHGCFGHHAAVGYSSMMSKTAVQKSCRRRL